MQFVLKLLTRGFAKQVNLGSVKVTYSGCLPPRLLHSVASTQCSGTWKNHYQPFAAVIHDLKNNIVLLVRDHLGVEPLYYYYTKDLLIAGQSIPDILSHLKSTPDYNQNYLNQLFTDHSMPYTNDTHFKNIYRLEPGHALSVNSGSMEEPQAFWQLAKKAPTLYYADERDYLAHFTTLMDEALLNAVGSETHCASEFSAGLDSSALYCTAKRLNISPTLFMHQPVKGTPSAEKYNDTFEAAFLNHYQPLNLHRICAESFDAIPIFKEYANWFGGPAPYLFFMFANPLHRAVADAQHPILLSGFGGDQCTSGIVPLSFYMPQLILNQQFRQAWQEIKGRSLLKRGLQFLKYSHPFLYHVAIRHQEKRWRRGIIPHPIHPYLRKYYRSVREAEWSLLQGSDSFEVRMRIEYSSIVAKRMGFSYRYPLLYPKLLEFMCSLPLTQKRDNQGGRYLIRCYLEQYLGKDNVRTFR